MPRYSVIIPIYNAERTLERCLGSLLGQGYDDAEIILINDGSADNSGAICKKYAELDQRIRYVHKSNGGVSSARNAGLELASGKYVLFVDSDDAVENSYFERLDRLDCEDCYDFIWFSYIKKGVHSAEVVLTPKTAENREECAQIFGDAICRKTMNSPWNKRYRNEIIQRNNIRFHTALSIGEDTLFNLTYALCCNKCLVSSSILYHVYVDDCQSLSRKIRKDLHEQFQMLDAEILNVIRCADVEESIRGKYIEAVNFTKLRSIYSEAKRMHQMQVDYRKRKETIRKMSKNVCTNHTLLPRNFLSILLQIPVRCRMILVIDQLGRILAR